MDWFLTDSMREALAKMSPRAAGLIITPEMIDRASKLSLDIGNVVLPAWFMLILLPRNRFTIPITRFAIAVNGLLYIANLARSLDAFDVSDMLSLPGLMNAFRNVPPSGMAAAWIHYLAFDLVAAEVQVRDAIKYGIPVWYTAPTLFLTLMAGPAGWIAYSIVRFMYTGKVFM